MKFEIKKGVFFHTLSSVWGNKKNFLQVILVDVAFIAAIYILGSVFNLLAPFLAQNALGVIPAFAAVYYLALLLVYSFFKYVALFFVKDTFYRHNLYLGRLLRFYLLNLIVFLALLAVYFLLGVFTSSVKDSVAPFVALAVLLIFSAFAYALVNFSQVFFYDGKSLKDSLLGSLKAAVKIKYYYGVFVVLIAALALIIIAFLLFGSVLQNAFFTSYNSLVRYGSLYQIVFVHSVGMIFYIGILFNRFYFYNIARKKFLN